MSKTEKFAEELATILPNNFKIINVDGKNINIECVKISEFDDFVDKQIRGPWIVVNNNNKFEVWKASHFIGRCEKTTKSLIDFLQKMCLDISGKIIDKNINMELCEYLVSEFGKANIQILIKSTLPIYAMYLVKIPTGAEYMIKATYKSEIVEVAKNDVNSSSFNPILKFNLSNPDIHNIICQKILNLEG